MKTNDIKKGMVVKLRNGWYGIMADNMKGTTRMVDVDGLYREIGSVYAHDIVRAWPKPNYILKLGDPIPKDGGGDELTDWFTFDSEVIEHTMAQDRLRRLVSAEGFGAP